MTKHFEAAPFSRDEVRYAALSPEQVIAFAEWLEKRGVKVPHPQLANIVVAYIGKEVVGYAVAQFIMHAEPLEVMIPYRGLGIAETLSEKIQTVIKEAGVTAYISVAQNQFAEDMCEASGMKAMPGKCFAKV